MSALSSGVCLSWFEIAALLAILPEGLADRDFEGVGQLHQCGQSKVLLASMQAAKSVCYFFRSWDTFAHCSRWAAAMNPLAFLSRLNQKSVVQALSLYSIFGCLESTDNSHTLFICKIREVLGPEEGRIFHKASQINCGLRDSKTKCLAQS